jgi:hypothetical protein
MNLSAIEKRVRTLEKMATQPRPNQRPICPSELQMDQGATSWSGQLEELTHQARLIMEQAKAAGDQRTALASIRLRCDIVELAAKLRGELDERSQTNVLSVNFDSDTIKRVAETFLARHGAVEPEPK